MGLLILCLAVFFWGCPGIGDEEIEGALTEVPENPNYEEHVSLITAAYCNKCHSDPPSNGAPPGIRSDICEGGAQTFAARFADRIGNAAAPMPPQSEIDRPGDIDIQTVQRWAEQGAPCAAGDMGADAGMDTSGDDTSPAANAFEDQVEPIFRTYSCLNPGCHDFAGGFVSAGLNLTTEAGTMAGGSSGLAVIRCEPDNSLLIQKLRAETVPTGSLMPIGAARVEDADLEILRNWIADGADTPGSCATSNGTSNNVSNNTGDPTFDGDVQPILQNNNCVNAGCHAPSGGFVSAGLDLTTEANTLAGGNSGPSVVRCDPDGSPLIQKRHEATARHGILAQLLD
ncbi:MAG: c-type cytochrome domain-containing protein, partial [Myxococcota bacterium]